MYTVGEPISAKSDISICNTFTYFNQNMEQIYTYQYLISPIMYTVGEPITVKADIPTCINDCVFHVEGI